MNTVSFTYQGKTHILQAPSGWNGVSAVQLVRWIMTLQSNRPDEEKLKLAVPIFYTIKNRFYKRIPEYYLVQFAPALRFLFGEILLTNWLIKSVCPERFNRYYGPADKLSNITAYEFFAYCERFYWKYDNKPDEEALNALIATLYREKRRTPIHDDQRCELTDAGIARRMKYVAKLPMALRMAIFFNYKGCRTYITALHKNAFSGKGGASKKRGDVTLALAGGPLGDLERTRKANLYDFLLHLEDLIEREEKLKEMTK
jgi:hypothetical protein